jgi:hypothetical protein
MINDGAVNSGSQRSVNDGAQHALARRTCQGTRKNGDPCRSTLVLDDGYCSAHSPATKVEMAELGRRGGKRSGEVRQEQAKSIRDRLREQVEQEFELVWQAFRDGLEAVDDAGQPDVRVRVVSAQALLAESYGRPPQAIVGDSDKPVSFVLQSAFAALEEAADRP